MAARGRAAAAAMAAERRLPSLDEFAGQSWSAWVERAGPPAEPGSGSELEESGKSGGKKLDAMTLIKEDMNIFGHCPAHDEFYLVVCNHCSQVVKPQAFQKHCERRHGPLSKLYARATAKCHVAVNGQPAAGGTPGTAKALREKPPGGARGRVQPLPERPDKDNNLCLFVPVVNLEKIPSIPKPDGHGIKVPPKAVPTNSKESLGKPATAAVPKEPPVSAGVGGDSAMPADGPGCKPESAPAPGEKDAGASKPPPRSHKKLARKECDLNRQCGVLNPDTKKICTRLLTCKIHSVHQRREVQGRAKDFDVLVAELKASSRKGESPKERSPPGKEPLAPPPAGPLLAAAAPPPAPPAPLPAEPSRPTRTARSPGPGFPLTATPRTRRPPPGRGAQGCSPSPCPRGAAGCQARRVRRRGARSPPGPPRAPPRPQAFCTFGSRLVSPGCYVFNRRLDRFCSALGSMLERHLSSHMWRKIPPAAEPPLHTPPAPPSPAIPPCGPAAPTPSPPTRTSSALTPPRHPGGPSPRQPQLHSGVPPCSGRLQPAGVRGGGAASLSPPRCRPTSPRPPSASCLPPRPANLPEPGKRPAGWIRIPANGSPPSPLAAPPINGPVRGTGLKAKIPVARFWPPPAKRNPPPLSLSCPASSSTAVLNGTTTRVKRLAPPDCRGPPGAAAVDPRGSPLHGPGVPPPPPRCISEDEVKKRKNAATYCRPVKPKPAPPPAWPPAAPRFSPPRLGWLRPQEETGDPPGLRGEAERPEVQGPL
ncbi:unnamed protein product, partial [Bubo scandiacus]